MSTDAQDITEAWTEGIDEARAVLFDDPTLELVGRTNNADSVVGRIFSGWFPTEERKEAEVDTLVTMEISADATILEDGAVAPVPLTRAHIATTKRVLYNGVRYILETWNAPQEAPRRWVLFLVQKAEGAVPK